MKLTKNLKLITLFLEFFEKPILGAYIWCTNQLAGDRNLLREIYRDDDYASGVSSCVLLNHGEKAENISQIFCIPPKPFFVRISEANADSIFLTAESGMARKPTTSSTT